MKVTFDEITHNKKINSYIANADKTLKVMGYTEHSFLHVLICVGVVERVLKHLDYDKHTIELGKISAYMHDIGNGVNRVGHGITGGTMAFVLLDRLEMDPDDISMIIQAIGHHDEFAAGSMSPVSAALILADKTDVRRSRVRPDTKDKDGIHYRVNYSCTDSEIYLKNNLFMLKLTIDTDICSVLDYFKAFMDRMDLTNEAAKFLGMEFELYINDQKMC